MLVKDRVGIFGGTFDPFTVAHEAIVKEVLDKDIVDIVYIVPTVVDYYREDKDKWLNFNERRAVIREFVNHLNDQNYNVEINYTDIDFANNYAPSIVKKHRYIDTLQQIIYSDNGMRKTAENDDYEYYTIIGSDSYKNFKSWTEWEEILKLSKLIVVNGRNGEIVESDIPKIDITIDPEFMNISSTQIRDEYSNKPYPENLDKYAQYIADIFTGRVIEERYFTFPIFDVVKKHINGLNFTPIGINSKDWVEIIVEKGGKYLMVEQLRYGLMVDQIEFPCGIIDPGETPQEAALRELHEETGYVIKNPADMKYLGKYAANPAFMNNYMHYFYINLDECEYTINEQDLDDNEDIDYWWKSKQEIYDSFLNSDNINSAIMAAGLLKVLHERKEA